VLFSLLLPVYVIFARARVPGWLKGFTLLALIVWSSLGQGQYFYYLPMFAVGAVLVAHWPALQELAARADTTPWAWPVFLLVAVLLTGSRWELIGLGMRESTAARHSWISVVGVTMLVLAAAFHAPVRRILQRRVVQWLGAVSFSLYLVHEPIIIAIRFLTVQHTPWLGAAISVPLALVVAAVFARLVEQPVQSLARRVGGSLTPRPRRALGA
jgi:peptidoglycan/LPS O-acetylase OafA/YrhL